jgi:hypothetical protein
MRPVADIIGDADNEIFEDNLLLINDAYQAVLGIRHVYGPPGSGSISKRSGSGSFPFLRKVFSGLKKCLKNKILTQSFSKKYEKVFFHPWSH